MSGICVMCARRECTGRDDDRYQCDKYLSYESNYERLFGTPERAAETLARMGVDAYNWCVDDGGNHKNCQPCPYEYDYWGCYLPEKFSMLVWLKARWNDER